MSFLDTLMAIDSKWKNYYLKKKIFEVKISKKPKFFITFPYPYVNGAPHIGHSFSFFRTDSYARFKRLQGYNVFFAQGFHATGEPIFGAYERLLKNDPSQLETFRLFGATEKEIEQFKKAPENIAFFWMKKWIKALKHASYSVDWRRSFITITEDYKRFVEWQFLKLRKKGYVIKKTYPVIWCPHCQSPTSDHARLVGEGEEPIKYWIIKFKLEDKILPCATLRPETVYGVTNIWINPREEYYWVRVGKETWLLVKQAIEKLKNQLKKIEVLGRANTQEILAKNAISPVTDKEVPILPARFVSGDMATGVVMSVPAHAPYDYVALQELKQDSFYKPIVEKIELISLFDVPGYGNYPAKEIVEKNKITTQDQKEKLDKLTEELYKKEYYEGKLKEVFGKLKGKRIEEAKNAIIMTFKSKALLDEMWETSGTVICRCGTLTFVKILRNQWFLNYENKEWKKKALEWAKKIKAYPEEARAQLINTIKQMKPKPCARKTGLGTRLPWDKDWVIESLSDSTIYPAYYIIAKYVNQKKLKPKNLKPSFFDYVLAGQGDAKQVAKECNLSKALLNQIRKEFQHFYPVDMRCSGKDLLQNHLVFYIYNHIAIWPQKYWPRAIAVNGFVNVEGEKMSKSKGNVIPLLDLIKKYGSDLVRANIITSAEGLDDANWQESNIKMLISRLKFVHNLVSQLKRAKRVKQNLLDKYIISVLHQKLLIVEDYYEQLKFRSAFRELLDFLNKIKFYVQVNGNVANCNKQVMSQLAKCLIIMLYPLFPNFCEEMNKKLGSKLLAFSSWPKASKKLISEELSRAAEIVNQTVEDIRNVMRITKIQTPSQIKIIIAKTWKFETANLLARQKNKKQLVKQISKKYKLTQKEVRAYISKREKKVLAIKKRILAEFFELAKPYLQSLFKAEIIIEDANKSKEKKAEVADIDKPAIVLKSL